MPTTKTSTTALQAAIKGEKVTDRQARSALGAAVDKISALSRRADKSRDAMMTTATAVVHTAETQGSLFLSSLAEGYLGADTLKMGGVDARAPLGLLTAGYGLYETMSGRGGGGHALAIGNGMLGSWLASAGVQAGRTLADQRAPSTSDLVEVGPTALQGLLSPPPLHADALDGPLREVFLTPEAIEGDDFGRRRGGGGGGGGGRGGGGGGRSSSRGGRGSSRGRSRGRSGGEGSRREGRGGQRRQQSGRHEAQQGGGERRERFQDYAQDRRGDRFPDDDDQQRSQKGRRRKRRHKMRQRFLQARESGEHPDFFDDFFDEPLD